MVKNSSLIIVIILLVFLLPSAHAEWKFHKQYGQTSIYTSSSGSRLVLEGKKTKLKPDKKFNQELLGSLELSKKKVLQHIGVTNWEVTNRKIEEGKDFTKVSFSGSYRNRKGEKLYFHESHIYRPQSKLQVLITNKELSSLEKELKNKSLEKLWMSYDVD